MQEKTPQKTQDKTKKAVLYARVSSKGQEREGFSIPAQLDLLREYAKTNGFEIVGEYVEAESAKQAGRKKFNEMMKFLAKNNDSVKDILVEKTDRLYRNLKDYVTIDESIYTVHLVRERFVLSPNSTSSEKLQHGFKVLVAKNFIDNLREETQKGIKRKIEEGYFLAQVPYGYKKLDKKNTILHPKKAKLVRRAFELYAKGDLSLRDVSKKLYSEGYIYKENYPKMQPWQLEFMLKNESYIGLIRYKGKLYEGKHPAIVSNIMFTKAQKAFRKDNKPRVMKNHCFTYKGLMRCAKCGRMITSEIVKKKHIYYHCTGNYGLCESKSIYVKEKKLDEQFENAIKKITLDESLADYLNEMLDTNYKEKEIVTKEKAMRLNREAEIIKARKDKLVEAYLDNAIKKDIFIKKQADYDELLQSIELQISFTKEENVQFINEGKNILQLVKSLYSLYLQQNVEEKQKMLKNLFYNATLDGENLSYEYKKPFCYFVKMNEIQEKYPRHDSNVRRLP